MLSLELINDILWWCLWGTLLWQAYILLFNRCIPNFKTAPPIRRAIINILKANRELIKSDTYTIIDMGCGDGKFTREIAKALPHAQVIGLEFGKIPYFKAVLWEKLSGLKNLKYINTDFNDYDTGHTNAIVMYLDAPFMKNMESKLQKELSTDTLVISNYYRFRGGWEPTQVHEIKTYRPRQGRFYVYKKA